MPRISEFFGIIIRMFFNDHSPAHFYAEYHGEEAVYTIDTLEVLRGELPAEHTQWWSNGQPYTGWSSAKTGSLHDKDLLFMQLSRWSNNYGRDGSSSKG